MDEDTKRELQAMDKRIDYLETVLIDYMLHQEVPSTREERAKVIQECLKKT